MPMSCSTSLRYFCENLVRLSSFSLPCLFSCCAIDFTCNGIQADSKCMLRGEKKERESDGIEEEERKEKRSKAEGNHVHVREREGEKRERRRRERGGREEGRGGREGRGIEG